jgi:hypothetical protein
MDANTAVRLSLRAIQGGCSLIALSTIAAGFYHESSAFGRSAMLGSHGTNFGMLLTYTTMLYSLYQIAAIEIFRTVPQFPSLIVVGLDAGFAAILFIAGIVLATSDYVSNCDLYGGLLKCGNLKAGTVFTFLAMAAFILNAVVIQFNLLNILLNRRAAAADVETGEPVEYMEESTPKALSPIAPSPSAKV